MSAIATLSVGTFDQVSWIRPEGKGNFLAGPPLKACADAEMQKGNSHLVIDLEACSSVDSTFMGTLAAVAKAIRRIKGGALEIADANDDNARAMKELGLAHLLKINPDDADWQEKKPEYRSRLAKPGESAEDVDKGEYVLKAHRELVAAHPENQEKFATLIKMLESEQKAKHAGE